MSTRLPSNPSSADVTWLDAESADSEPAAPQPSAGTKDPLLGTTLLDAYAVDRVLGEGGMGRIYEAHHVRLPAKRYAIKALRPELLASPNVRARFEREVEAVSRITHAGVVGIADVGTTASGVPFMVCEHLSGLDLLAYIRRFGPLSNERALHMGCRIAEALEAAHAQGVIHRDIKPSNIFLLGAFEPLGPEWDRVKIIDFGLSRIAGRDDQLTATGIVMGTPAYMSPEQARGARTDPRTDVYGIGAVLYAAATGGPPFREKTPQQTLLAVMGREPVRPRERAPGISEELELIIQRAMSKEPEQRYPSMSALRLALAQLELATSMAAVPRARPSSAPPRSVRARFAALAIGCGVLALGAVASIIRSAPLRDDGEWTRLERAALLVLAVAMSLGLMRLLRRFRATVWSNTATMSDMLPRLQAPLFAGLLGYVLTSLVSLLAGEQLLAVARSHSAPWGAVIIFPSAAVLPSVAALLAALALVAHQTWWAPLRPLVRWVSVPALAAVVALAAFTPTHWRWLIDPDDGPFAGATQIFSDAPPSATSDEAPPAASQTPDVGSPAPGGSSLDSMGVTPLENTDAGAHTTPPSLDAGRGQPALVPTVAPLVAAPLVASPVGTAPVGTTPLVAPPLVAAPLVEANPTPGSRPATNVAPAPFAVSTADVAPPLDSNSPEGLKAEMLAHARRPGELTDALRTVERLLAIAPSAGADPDVRRTLRLAANSSGEPAQIAFRLMSSAMGSNGPDLLYHIMLWQPSIADKAKYYLSRNRVRELFSPELAIAYDLRFAPSCPARLGLLPRASEVGDQRTINTLAALVTPTPDCGQPNHPPCLDLCEREAAQFARTVDAIVRRIRSSERAASAN